MVYTRTYLSCSICTCSWTKKSAVRQGCLMSAPLFNIIMRHVMQKITEKERGISCIGNTALKRHRTGHDLAYIHMHTEDTLWELVKFKSNLFTSTGRYNQFSQTRIEGTEMTSCITLFTTMGIQNLKMKKGTNYVCYSLYNFNNDSHNM